MRNCLHTVGLLAILAAVALSSHHVAAQQGPPPSQAQRAGDTGDAQRRTPPLPAPEEAFRRTLREPVPATRADISAAPTLPTVGGSWTSQGPGPITNGQVEGITDGLVVGAIQAIVAHPTDADVAWIGAVNGGVWKTTNATSASPTWTPLSDEFGSLSIGALEMDPTDVTRNTLVAGIGRFSSFGGVGGPRIGLLRTTNGGTGWTPLSSAILLGKNISGLAARGAAMVVSVNIADPFTCSNIGIFRSIDTGGSFTRVSGGSGTGLPEGRAFDLASDPSNNAVLYTAIRDTQVCTGGNANGVYRSTDTGATWTKVSSADMDALLVDGVNPNNTRIAVGASGQVFAGIINSGQLGGLFRSPTGLVGSWTQLDTPTTNEGGSIIGIQPTQKAGSQGSIHFSIVADPTDANIVYVGGDRQPLNGDGNATTPNSLGATNYTGRLFRVDASLSPGSQAMSLTHCQTATMACGGVVSTNNNSAPHADSRRMVFDADGNILEGDDGGFYRRTNPRGTGDWFSANGNLRVTEMHDVAYDSVSNMIIGGNQDTGTSEQTTVGGTTWSQVSQGDGGDVAVDDMTSASQSTRYSSFQFLGAFRRRMVDASGDTTSTVFPALLVTGGGPDFVGQFSTPVELNAIDPARILFAGDNLLYESLDRGDTMTALVGSPAAVTAMVYGGKSGDVDNPALIYAIVDSRVFVRTSGMGPPAETATAPGLAALRDITVDPADWQKAYVVNNLGEVYSTSNTGGTWTNITGDLVDGPTDLRTIVAISGSPAAIVVGGVGGVFRMTPDATGVWKQLGTGLTGAPVWDMEYDAADDMLVASTMGRGAWGLSPVTDPPDPPANLTATATGATAVEVSWTPVDGATTYNVYRSDDGADYSLVGSSSDTTFSDTTASANMSYLYKARSVAGSESGDSNVDLATTVLFTDPTITSGVTQVKLVHFTQLLAAVNAVRSLAGLGAVAFTAPAPATSVTVRAQHVLDLRSALAAALSALGLDPVTFTDATITIGLTIIKLVHITELRGGVM